MTHISSFEETPDEHFDTTLCVGTDEAAWYLYHPDDLAHRNKAPSAWPSFPFAVHKEFAEGNLITLRTGSDGGHLIRFTNGELTESEKQRWVDSQTFRIEVRHGCLYLDGGDSIPNGEYLREVPRYCPDNWLILPNGKYQATVHALLWEEELETEENEENEENEESTLPWYVTIFQFVESFDGVPFPDDIPVLLPERSLPLEEVEEDEDEDEETISSIHPVLVWPNVIYPNIVRMLPIDESQCDYMGDLYVESCDLVDIPTLLLVGEAKVGTTASLVMFDGVGGEGYGGKTQYHLNVTGLYPVKIVSLQQQDETFFAEVEKIVSDSFASSADVQEMRKRFTHYATTSSWFQQHVAFPAFYLEQVESENDPEQLAWLIANALELPLSIQIQLLEASHRDRVQLLIQALIDQDLQ
jgi:ATP-dependent protease La (LON) substrate-binding domain